MSERETTIHPSVTKKNKYTYTALRKKTVFLEHSAFPSLLILPHTHKHTQKREECMYFFVVVEKKGKT